MKSVILLSTFNGEKYLKELLESLYNQKDFSKYNIDILVRDDGSEDKTIEILNQYIKYKNFKLILDKNVGVIRSFEILLKESLKNGYDFIFFCDQDDIWMENKISMYLEHSIIDKPLMIYSDLYIFKNGKKIDTFYSYTNLKKKIFLNKLLLENNVVGCTIMINKKMANLLLPFSNKIIMHDWWIALVASLFGKIVFLDEPLVKYRIHQNNTIGVNEGFFRRITNFNSTKHYNQASYLLEKFRNKLPYEKVKIIEEFLEMKNKNIFGRYHLMKKNNFLSSSFFKNIGMVLK